VRNSGIQLDTARYTARYVRISLDTVRYSGRYGGYAATWLDTGTGIQRDAKDTVGYRQ